MNVAAIVSVLNSYGAVAIHFINQPVIWDGLISPPPEMCAFGSGWLLHPP